MPDKDKKGFGEEGFTLLETILTLAMIVGLMAILLAAIRISVRAWEKGEDRIGAVAAKASVAGRLTEDTSSMLPYMVRKDGAAKYVFMGGPRRLTFVTVAHSGGFPIPWGGTVQVDYHLEKDGLVITERTLPEGEKATSERSVEIGPGIRDARFEYLGDEGWQEWWDAGKKDGLPKAVRAVFMAGDGKDNFTVTAPVRASKVKPPSNTGNKPL